MAYEYLNLQDKDSEVESHEIGPLSMTKSHKGSSTRNNSLYFTILRTAKDIALVLLSLTCIVAYVSGQSNQDKLSHMPCDCGNSVSEALAKGCVYDDLAPAWLPQHCMDHDLKAVFDKAGDGPGGEWQYFADANLTHKLTKQEVGLLADTPERYFYTTARWHLMHCNYYWRKMFRSHHNGVTVEGRYNSERHVKHCGEIFETYPEPSTFSYVALKSSSEEPPDFEMHRLKDLNIDPFEFRVDKAKEHMKN